MWLIAGLGNPGRKYQRTRHNIGFHVVDELLRRHLRGGFQTKFGGEAATGFVSATKVLLLKPMEFMNRSGFAIQRAAQYYDLAAEKILVVHDDIDLDFGRLRLKSGGGHGGHNGLRSVIAQLGDRDFLRVRVGVGKPEKATGGPGDGAVVSHVLGEFSAEQARQVDDVVARAADATEAILADGISAAMNDFNR